MKGCQEGTLGWNIRNVVYEYIHAINPENLKTLVEHLEMSDGNIVVDLMSGYGSVMKEVLRQAHEKSISIVPVLVDMYEEQLDRAITELHLTLRDGNFGKSIHLEDGTQCYLKQEDARKLYCFWNNSLDRVVIKMGVHEVPKTDQQKIISEAYRVLKFGGVFGVWDLLPLGKQEQRVIQDIIRKKDELAGLESLAEQRYFFRRDEVWNYLEHAGDSHYYPYKAGFKDIEEVSTFPFCLSTEGRLDAEFHGDHNKLECWNNYIRYRVPPSMRSFFQYRDNGHTIQLMFRDGIIKGRK
ncbi:class I SAM-dependent methyltransferase [Candidatus Woesearchaeota archaeon]|nr:class I SAM-dependent methyltransferase [Candidatus Woesearchaeota archaeon]